MKKTIIIVIMCLLICLAVTGTSQQSSKTTPEKSLRQRLTELENKYEVLAERIRWLEQNSEPGQQPQQPGQPEKEGSNKPLDRESIARLEESIETMRSQGLVYSMDVDLNEVRADLALWDTLDLGLKQNFVMIFSAYFEAMGSTRRVTVLSNRNDEKLATFGSWGGLKILR